MEKLAVKIGQEDEYDLRVEPKVIDFFYSGYGTI